LPVIFELIVLHGGDKFYSSTNCAAKLQIIIDIAKFIRKKGREGFEGTDLAALSHLERPYSATGILCNPK
jgi:hypothetical protein